MNSAIVEQIASLVGSPIKELTPVSGGDISSAYRIRTQTDQMFCKINTGSEAFKMFDAERVGLQAIRESRVIQAPEVYFCEALDNGAALVMEYVESKRGSESEMAQFGEKLARLHQQHGDFFGWDRNNFIGSLPQTNSKNLNWAIFYTEERLMPQLKLEVERSLLDRDEVPETTKMTGVLTELFDGVRPSLLHGDLWSGNYLINAEGVPYLIDPAAYYGHSEVDIAMSKLFGGFSPGFYSSYEKIHSGDKATEDRILIYQLYYLLVHLNLFGRSYYAGVIHILKQYF